MEFGLYEMWQQGWLSVLARGAVMTLVIASIAMALALVLGTALALIKWARLRVFSILIDIYTLIIRGVPELLVIYLFFYASEAVLTKVATAFGYGGFMAALFPFCAVVLAIGLISAAYATETLRGALNTIPRGHIEAARALGLRRGRIFRRIILPQMLRVALPGLNNIWQSTIKDTALVSLVAVGELLYRTKLGADSTGHPFLFYIIAVIGYLITTAMSQTVFNRCERRFRLKAM